jgi:hypothetical protein
MAAVIAVMGTLFWLYTFYAIDRVPQGDGSGFQWLAVVPLGGIFAIFFLPAWLLVAIGRLPRVTMAWRIAGLVAFAVVWMQLLAEFPKK